MQPSAPPPAPARRRGDEMTSEELKRLIADANARYEAMTPEQQAEMWRLQRESYVRSIIEWPKPKFEWINGVKVYASFEDYCND